MTLDECAGRETDVREAHSRAMVMTRSAISKLLAYDGSSPVNVRDSLSRHFHSNSKIIALIVASNLIDVRDDAEDVQYECHSSETSGSTLAWSMWGVPFTDILLYRPWFFEPLDSKANTMVHEWMHRYGCKLDVGYDFEDSYKESGTLRALVNAEPYGNLVQDIGI